MQALLLWSASLTCLITFGVHLFVGGVYVARPLLADETLPRASKWLNYYCWHVTSVFILVLAGAFGYLTRMPEHRDLAIFASALVLTLAILSAIVAAMGHIHPLRFPSTSLFALAAIFGLCSALV